MPSEYIHRFVTSLIFTVLVETSVISLLLWFVFKKRELNRWKIIFAGVFASFATIPYVWFVFPSIASWNGKTHLLYSEPFAFLIEALFYRLFLRVDMRVALALSLVANLASYFLGQCLRTYGLWPSW